MKLIFTAQRKGVSIEIDLLGWIQFYSPPNSSSPFIRFLNRRGFDVICPCVIYIIPWIKNGSSSSRKCQMRCWLIIFEGYIPVRAIAQSIFSCVRHRPSHSPIPLAVHKWHWCTISVSAVPSDWPPFLQPHQAGYVDFTIIHLLMLLAFPAKPPV